MKPDDLQRMTSVAALPGDPPKRARNPLRVVQSNPDSGFVFVFVLAGYGDAFAAVELGRGLGAETTVVALQPPDDDAQFKTLGTARALAEFYVAELVAAVPRGPYVIGGYSAGALLAYEVAQVLRTRTGEAPLLVLFDPLFLRYSRFEQACYGTLKGLVERTGWVAPVFPPHRILAAMMQDKGLERHLLALEQYEPQPYPGRIVLVETGVSRFLRPPTFLSGWRKIAGHGLERRRAHGNHHTFIRPPHVKTLARQLGEWIGRPPPHAAG
jgi:thioesterase domain-containing protein